LQLVQRQPTVTTPCHRAVTLDTAPSHTPRAPPRRTAPHLTHTKIHWPDRYVPLFGAPAYDIANERPDDVPFEEQLRGLEQVVKAGKVGRKHYGFWGSGHGSA
jgi:hypothetical protein